MASARKKQEESNVKSLRELGALAQNKFCFDCGQRGPTYVNVTIGSFVCTKCSGMLRGITPPHRVKSISMATFTPEEIDTLREKGNDHCRRTWLGLYEGTLPSHTDEQGVRDFMVEKYEKKRYYLEKSMTHHQDHNRTHLNGSTKTQLNGFSRTNLNNNKINGTTQQNGVHRQVGTTRSRPEVKNSTNNNLCSNFDVDFDKADIFSNASTVSSKSSSTTDTPQNGFANFDSNPLFDNAPTSNKDISTSPWSVQSAQPQIVYPNVNGITPLQPNTNGFHLNANGSHPNVNDIEPKINGIKPTVNGINIAHAPVQNSTQFTSAQDKYAALKDLDEEMKSHTQTQPDIWSSSNGSSSGSLYSSPTPTTGSAYGSPSSQGSMFDSPSQGQFLSAFPDNITNGPSNPFNTSTWGPNAVPNPQTNINGFAKFNNTTYNGNVTNGSSTGGANGQAFFNPFKQEPNMNGFANFGAFFPQNGVATNGVGDAWGGNPFKVSSNVGMPANCSNPFL